MQSLSMLGEPRACGVLPGIEPNPAPILEAGEDTYSELI